jgi:hypothetical protein
MKRIFRTTLKVQFLKLWSFFRLKLGTNVDLVCTFEQSSLVPVSDIFFKTGQIGYSEKKGFANESIHGNLVGKNPPKPSYLEGINPEFPILRQ